MSTLPLGILQERIDGFAPVICFNGITRGVPSESQDFLIHPAFPVLAHQFRNLLLHFGPLNQLFMF